MATLVAEWSKAIGAQHGLAEGRAAEVFRVVDTG
jgi:hypothetical protein